MLACFKRGDANRVTPPAKKVWRFAQSVALPLDDEAKKAVPRSLP